MNIQSISKENANANVTLSASELVLIYNMFHEQLAKEKSNPKFLELYGDLMLARDLCQYGHVDNFCLGGIVKCRNSIGNGVNGVLSDEDIDKFNNFLEDMPTALDNAEWWNLYRRIAGDRGLHRCNDKLKQYEKAHADAIGYPVTRESLKNPKVRDTDILFKESLEELKARDLLTDATGRPDNAENPENSSYKSQLNDYVSEIEKIAAQLTMSQSDGYSHILRICDAMKRELTVSAEMEDDL